MEEGIHSAATFHFFVKAACLDLLGVRGLKEDQRSGMCAELVGAFSEHGDLPCIAGVVVRRFQNEGQMTELWMADDARQSLESEFPFADARMAVFAGGAHVETVVEVDGMEVGQPDHAIELVKDAVEVIDDVVAGIPDVAGIETDAELFLAVHAVDDGGELFEAASDLRALARHGFQENQRLL